MKNVLGDDVIVGLSVSHLSYSISSSQTLASPLLCPRVIYTPY